MAYYNRITRAQIEEVARFGYINAEMKKNWNEYRRGDELFLVTGYSWYERGGQRRSRHGFKTPTAAMRDAYYVLIQHREQPADLGRAAIRLATAA